MVDLSLAMPSVNFTTLGIWFLSVFALFILIVLKTGGRRKLESFPIFKDVLAQWTVFAILIDRRGSKPVINPFEKGRRISIGNKDAYELRTDMGILPPPEYDEVYTTWNGKSVVIIYKTGSKEYHYSKINETDITPVLRESIKMWYAEETDREADHWKESKEWWEQALPYITILFVGLSVAFIINMGAETITQALQTFQPSVDSLASSVSQLAPILKQFLGAPPDVG